MDYLSEKALLKLVEKEHWEVRQGRVLRAGVDSSFEVHVPGDDEIYPLTHPYQIHLKLYRKLTAAAEKFAHMKAAHDYLWPEFARTWNDWDERRFFAHCEGYSHVVLAGGASTGKSHCAARIASLFWLANPKKRTVLVASVTLESLESRIWGYVMEIMENPAVPIPANVQRSKPPKILYPGRASKIHGMFASAVRSGDAEKVISTLIGRHPKEGLLVVLDEATDMPPTIVKSLANLEKVPIFQLIPIGNSNSKNDLHGALATPRAGWENIDPDRDKCWPTMHRNGICLYFNPYDSPAIWEPNDEKRELLSRFLLTTAEIEEKKREYGEDSDSYYRFVLGWWRPTPIENIIVSEKFLQEHEVRRGAEWSGFYPLAVVGGLDPAYQIGGMGCLLRLGILGHTTSGLVVLDFRKEELVFRIDIKPKQAKSGELQLAEQVIEKLREYSCPLRNVFIDATGTGRALGELIRVVSGEEAGPWKMVSVRKSSGLNQKTDEDPWMVVGTPYDLWSKMQEFVQHKQIRNLDEKTIFQITNRLIIKEGKRSRLETKTEYKDRLATISPKSALHPDEADAAILALHAAIMSRGFSAGQRWEMPNADVVAWEKKLRTYQAGQARVESGQNGYRRAKLVPNFSGTLESVAESRRHRN